MRLSSLVISRPLGLALGFALFFAFGLSARADTHLGATTLLSSMEGRRCTVRLAGGWVVDGSGSSGYLGDVLLSDQRILVAVDQGDRQLTERTARIDCDRTIDVGGLVVAPGFINMLSWATESLLLDPRALSDVTQGVTLEVMGEGRSMGPFVNSQTAKIRSPGSKEVLESSWKSLGDYFDLLDQAGIGVNVASYVGATTIREYVMGGASRPPSDIELAKMRGLVTQAMRDGAMGVGSSLIYAPANFATTEELAALAAEAARAGGGYISHLRSEAREFLSAVRELIDIAERSGAKAEIYHLKAAGEANWHKLSQAIALVERARARGLPVTANVYPYTAAATGLDAVMPPWVQLGGVKPWVERLKDPATRARVIQEMRDPASDWENLLLDGAERALVLGVRNRKLNGYVGMTLAEIAKKRGVSAEDAAIDLVIADRSKLSVAYTLMSEANLQEKLRLEWVSIGSDAAAPSAEGGFLYRNQHPRAYGSFARVLGRYVRELHTLELEEAVYRMTGLPADNLGLVDRGRLVPGYFADLAIFDAATVSDNSTFEDSHRYATGVRHVFVNGEQAIANGRPTGALAGQIVRGPGFISSD